ncbi:ParB/RepB/Spo0J family partition protein [Streptantibioticus silvisoli]|uniref:ParB-like N-terminal domain-containing protein n=1 Tax=Streptantibioticus silvisoli TaxID=2705255 RepID=A0ABT6VZ94_9ACTN|nr:hypothetical protein [Streptantibioticus silvisoli]MDI5963475.1 hypothetical protein [Streptantibioticus silvisoli]
MSQHEAPGWPSEEPPAFAGCEPTAWLSGQLAASTVRRIRVSSLNLDFTLRQDRVNIEHVQILAGITEELPPIVVHDPSGRVLDGIHRVHAALAQGRSHISAIVYSGSDEDAFAVAVRLNTAHGLPLSRAERIAAAQRILRTHPRWSNRMIAGVTGLAESTVRVRRRDLPEAEPGPGPRSCSRVGRDGRVRPVNAAEGRLRAGRLLAERPTASAREIARQAGVSPNTVLDVRRRLAEGREPVPVQARGGEAGAPAAPRPTGPGDLEKVTTAVLAGLMADPSIRLNDRGRFLIRWMRANREALSTRSDVACAIPDHWLVPVAKLARAYSLFWQELARELEHRSAKPPVRSADPVLGPPGLP